MDRTFKKATLSLAIMVAGLLLVISLFNYITNAYGVFDHKLLDHDQPAGRENVRLVTAYNLKHQPFDGLIFGSSRGSLGVNPNSDKLPGNWYNASLPGTSLTEVYYYLQHAAVNNPALKTVVLGLDYYMFKPAGRTFRQDFSFDRLDTDHPASFPIKDYLDTLFSIDSLKSSFNTVRKLDQPGPFTKGMWHSESGNINTKSVEEIFATVAEKITREPIVLDQEKFDTLAKILRFCHEHQIKLVLYLHPYHQYTKSHFEFETGDDRTLIERIHQINQAVASDLTRPMFEFWDFGDNNPITALSFANRALLFEYYFEGSHYTPQTGDLLLCRIFKVPSCPAPEGFGKLISNPHQLK